MVYVVGTNIIAMYVILIIINNTYYRITFNVKTKYYTVNLNVKTSFCGHWSAV